MAVLHLVNHVQALAACLAVAADDDTVLLIEDGVYGAVGAAARPLHVLEADVVARGIGGRLAERITTTDDAGFVALVETHQPVVTWR